MQYACAPQGGYTVHSFEIVPQCMAGARRSVEANGFQCRVRGWVHLHIRYRRGRSTKYNRIIINTILLHPKLN